MSIKEKIDWLRGFLDSLEYSDNVSSKQIKILKAKIDELVEDISLAINIDPGNDDSIEEAEFDDLEPSRFFNDSDFSNDDISGEDLPF